MPKKSETPSKDQFQKQVFTLLRNIGVTPRRYYDYADFAELIGFQAPAAPFKLPLKVVAEAIWTKLTVARQAAEVRRPRDAS
jgi:hypothetical protein